MKVTVSDGIEVERSAARRILVAEDNSLNQMVADGLLRLLGYESHCVSDGWQAIEALQASHFPIVLMDVHMPNCDGYEATRRVRRELPRDRQPYIIALTASVLHHDMERCLAVGMDDCVTKPVNKLSLSAALQRAEALRHPDS